MRLLRLKLNTPFRSLAEGFEVHFLREWDYERCFEFFTPTVWRVAMAAVNPTFSKHSPLFSTISNASILITGQMASSSTRTPIQADSGLKYVRRTLSKSNIFSPNENLVSREPLSKNDDRPMAHISY